MKLLIYSIFFLSVIVSCGKEEPLTPDNTILIGNFLGCGANAKSVVSRTSLSIPNQIANVQGNSVTINSGIGMINGSLLTIAYGYSFNNQTESC
jgi:hypothetical protein